MFRRLRQAAMVLAGYRPAEVRSDEEDERIAKEIGRVWGVTFAGGYPELKGTYPEMIDDTGDMFFLAMKDYASWRRQERDQARFEKRRDREDHRYREEFGF